MPEITHPEWCASSECVVGETDVQHQSKPWCIAARGTAAKIVLVRTDEFVFGRPGGTELTMYLTDQDDTGEQTRYYIDCAGAQELSALLTVAVVHAYTAQDVTTEEQAIMAGCREVAC